MTKALYRRKSLFGAYSFVRWVHGYGSREHVSRQADVSGFSKLTSLSQCRRQREGGGREEGRELTRNGVGFWNLKAYSQWHTSSDKAFHAPSRMAHLAHLTAVNQFPSLKSHCLPHSSTPKVRPVTAIQFLAPNSVLITWIQFLAPTRAHNQLWLQLQQEPDAIFQPL